MIAWADVLAAFPDDLTLAGIDAAEEGAIYVSWAEEQVDDAVILRRADELRILLAAHAATVAVGGGLGAGGPVSSESVDGVSRTYAVTSVAGDLGDYGSTSYGRRARAIMATSPRARLPRAL